MNYPLILVTFLLLIVTVTVHLIVQQKDTFELDSTKQPQIWTSYGDIMSIINASR